MRFTFVTTRQFLSASRLWFGFTASSRIPRFGREPSHSTGGTFPHEVTNFTSARIPKLLVTFWTAAASEARRRFGVSPAERSTRTSDPRAAQSAVAAALCRRSPYPSDRFIPHQHLRDAPQPLSNTQQPNCGTAEPAMRRRKTRVADWLFHESENDLLVFGRYLRWLSDDG